MINRIPAIAIALVAAIAAFFIFGNKKTYDGTYIVRLSPKYPDPSAVSASTNLIKDKLNASGNKWELTAGTDPSLLKIKVQQMKDTAWFLNNIIPVGSFEICELDISVGMKVFTTWDVIDSAACKLYPQTCGLPSAEISEGQYSDEVLLSMGQIRAHHIPIFSQPVKNGPEILNVNLKDTAAVGRIFRHPLVRNIYPSDVTYCFGKIDQPGNQPKNMLQLYMVRRRPTAIITNGHIDSADVSREHGRDVVKLKLNTEGTQRFKNLTTANRGLPIPIIYNGLIILMPTVYDVINNGTLTIQSPVLTKEEVENISHAFKAPDWPAMPRLESAELKKVGAGGGMTSVLISLAVFAAVFMVAFLLFKFLKSTRPAPVSGEK